MNYVVLRIDEDLEFGCEERGDEQPRLAVVTLQDESGNILVHKFEDDRLYLDGIEEGDSVQISRDGRLCKASR